MQNDLVTALGELVRGFGSGETTTYNMDFRAHGESITAGTLRVPERCRPAAPAGELPRAFGRGQLPGAPPPDPQPEFGTDCV